MKSSFNLSIEGGVEVSEGIVAVGIEIALLFDVVLVVLLAYLVHAEQNVYHAHFLTPTTTFFPLERKRERMERRWDQKKKLIFGLVFLALLFFVFHSVPPIFRTPVWSNEAWSVDSGFGEGRERHQLGLDKMIGFVFGGLIAPTPNCLSQ
jgi:hypothetical protein